MYCPKCAEPLEKRRGTWHCTSGGLELSRHMGDHLEERFSADYKPGRRFATDMRINRWYCPSCGVPTDGEMRCPDCAHSLRDFLYELAELHPHAAGNGGWR